MIAPARTTLGCIFMVLTTALACRRPGLSGSGTGRTGDQQRLAHQGIEQIQGGEVVWGVWESRYGAGALEVKSPGEHRTPFQQCLFGVVEQAVGPRHRVAQRLMARQPTPGPHQQPEPLIQTITHLAGGHRLHP
jgi:hypothetical protein